MNTKRFSFVRESDDFLQCFVTLVPARWCPKLGAICSASKTKECFLKNKTIGNRRLFQGTYNIFLEGGDEEFSSANNAPLQSLFSSGANNYCKLINMQVSNQHL